jgi:hypothetical protein
VATGTTIQSTNFVVPIGVDKGQAELCVVANSISSPCIPIIIAYGGKNVLVDLTGIVSIAGYYDPAANDQNQHVIVATNDGKVTELWWKPGQGVHQDILTQFGANSIVSYYADGDVFWKPGQGVHERVLVDFNSIVSIAGYYDPAKNDHNQHTIIAATNNVIEVWWRA